MKKIESTPAAKILGFNGTIGKSVRKVEAGKVTIRVRTVAELLDDPLFANSVSEAASRLADTDPKGRAVSEIRAELHTKRQASKFFRGEGVVYKTVMEGGEKNEG